MFPNIKLHTLGPPEIAHITKLEKAPTVKYSRLYRKREWTAYPEPGRRY